MKNGPDKITVEEISAEIEILITGNTRQFPKEKNIITPREFIEIINTEIGALHITRLSENLVYYI
jgi:hypothetical protein